jgi:hypothetical protein
MALGGLDETSLCRRAALERREAASSVAPVFDFNTRAGGWDSLNGRTSRREVRGASHPPANPDDEARSVKPS